MKREATALGLIAALALLMGKNIGGAIWAVPTLASFEGGPSAVFAMALTVYLFPTMGTYLLITISGFRLPNQFPEVFEGRETRFSAKTVKWTSLLSTIIMFSFLITLSWGDLVLLLIFLSFLGAGLIYYYLRRKQVPKEEILPKEFSFE